MMKPLNRGKELNRRKMLRGTGAVIALPFLESLAASRHVDASVSTADHCTSETPMRMACIGLECHRKIDPIGFALESFDPIRSLRHRYSNESGTLISIVDTLERLQVEKHSMTSPN